MGYQKEIAKTIINGDYVLAVKGNLPMLLGERQDTFKDKSAKVSRTEDVERSY